ncbi:MAG: RNA polymerase subunit sigma-70, partial [Acidimicrobiales bacterium]
MTGDETIGDEDALAVVTSGDEAAFARLVQRHRRELHVHCYRMTGNFEEAEDLVQETFLRAWSRRETFAAHEGGRLFRAWLYRIATNACLDAERKRKRRVPSLANSFGDVPWIQPYPDVLLDEIVADPTAGDDDPGVRAVTRESVELAFLAIIQLLPPKQRAVLLLRDVLGWPAEQTATMLETTVPSANSALQRARATLEQHTIGDDLGRPLKEPTPEDLELLAAFIDAHERSDPDAAIAIARRDIRITMPPQPVLFETIGEIGPLLR